MTRLALAFICGTVVGAGWLLSCPPLSPLCWWSWPLAVCAFAVVMSVRLRWTR